MWVKFESEIIVVNSDLKPQSQGLDSILECILKYIFNVRIRSPKSLLAIYKVFRQVDACQGPILIQRGKLCALPNSGGFRGINIANGFGDSHMVDIFAEVWYLETIAAGPTATAEQDIVYTFER